MILVQCMRTPQHYSAPLSSPHGLDVNMGVMDKSFTLSVDDLADFFTYKTNPSIGLSQLHSFRKSALSLLTEAEGSEPLH